MSIPRVWLITGTSSGFGRRFIPSILRRGDRVIATARNIQSIQKPHFFPHSDSLRTMQLDVSADEALLRMKAEEALQFWGRVDVLVNNAGYSLKMLAEDATLADFQTQFQTNLYGPVALTRAFLPQMRSRKEGTIVMIGSRSSWNPSEAISIYAASKAALRVYSETLAKELSSQFPRIRTIIVEPSSFRTEQSILGYPLQIPPDADPVYTAMRERIQSMFEALDKKQRGDPDKAVELIVDVVRGEGKATSKSKESLVYVPLGREANKDLAGKCATMLEVVKDWRDVADNLDYDDVSDSVDLTSWGK